METDALIYVQSRNKKIELNDGSSSTKGRCNLTGKYARHFTGL